MSTENNSKLADAIRGAYTVELTFKKWNYDLYTIPRWGTLREAIAEQDHETAIRQVNWFLTHIRRGEAAKCATLVEQQAALKPLNTFIQARFAMSMADLASDCAAPHQVSATPANP